MDPATGQVTRLDVADTAGLGGRADPGVYLDPLSPLRQVVEHLRTATMVKEQ